MKIGIFGGTFNPPHKGHRFLVDTVMRRMKFDQMIIMPSSVPPHKEVEENYPMHRLKMTQLAFPEYIVSDLELTRDGKSYTVDTLRALSGEYPEAQLYFLCGSDMFLSLEQWKDPAAIFSMATIVTVAREKRVYLRLLFKKWYFHFKYGAKSRILFVEPIELSSSDIRKGLVSADSVEPAVYQYMTEHNLYGEKHDAV